MERVSTGISGLDNMLSGGFIAGRPYLISGGPGSGKTIMAFQFLMNGIENGENVLYITMEEPYNELRENMSNFGWDAEKVRILDLSPGGKDGADTTPLNYLIEELDEEIRESKHSRVVVDSITTIKLLEEKALYARRRVLSIMKLLTDTGCTSLLIAETLGDEISMEAFLARGVIRIHTSKKTGEKIRALSIDKFRGSKFDEHIRPMRITDNGIIVDEDEVVIDTFV